MDAPLEQHYCRHPEEFFMRTLEARLPDVLNPILLRGHMLCAAVELAPLPEADVSAWFGPPAQPVLDECRKEGRLVPQMPPGRAGAASDEAVMFRHVQGRCGKAPKEEVNLRDIDPVQFQVIVRGSTAPIETLDQKLAYMRLHPGALYLNQRHAYIVEELDLAKRVAWCRPADAKRLDYYTECREHSQVVLCGGGLGRPAELPVTVAAEVRDTVPVVRSGRITVHWRMYGFRKKARADHRILDQIDLSLPPVEYPSSAVWMDLPGAVLQPVAKDGHSVDRGGLHALEHAMISMAPACCDLDVAELSCQHTRRDSDPNRYLLLLFESQKGGVGAAPKVYKQWEVLFARAVALIEECPCDEGCPNCIVAPMCGEYNHGLDKAAALKIGRALGFGSKCAAVPASTGSLPTQAETGVSDATTSTHTATSASAPVGRRAGVFTQRLGAARTLQGGREDVCLDLD